MASTLNLTRDMARTTAEISTRQLERNRLSHDWIALLILFLIVATYHIQNPLLQFELQFGRAFRNVTLQPALALALVVSGLIFVGNWRLVTRVRWVLVAGFGLFVLHVLLAILLDFNALGVIFGVPQSAFLAQVEDETLLAGLQNALNVSTIMEYVALACVLLLWSPWTRFSLYRRSVQRNFAPLAVALLTLILWEVAIDVFRVQEFFLPKPTTIGTTFIEIYPRLMTVGWNTFQNAFWGFVVGCGLGVVVGMISARFTNFSKSLLPLAIAINSTPIIAFAPIVNFWFGALNPASKVAIVAILTFFPAMISTVKGLTTVNITALELMKSYAASDWVIFRKLRFPSALPYIFSALKVGTTLSMIGAIVSEYFGGTTQGLGYRIREDAALFDYPEAWAAIIVASVLGILFYALVSAVERAVMPWHVSFRDE
ncbi:MAG: ABC transporter permease [Chloroflexi bacterium]|nr:ABC transporter permease [Chloroflexota bacterium]